MERNDAMITEADHKKQAGGVRTGERPDLPGGGQWIIDMKRGLPGFEGVRRYSLASKGGETPFCLLSGIDKGPTFIVINPFLVCPDYSPVLPEREARFLGIDDPSRAILFVIVTIRRDPLDVTVNLRAPVVINADLNTAAQVVLEDSELPLRHSIMPKKGK